MKNLIIIILLGAFAFSCSDQKEQSEKSGKPVVVATTGMIGDAIKNIAGDKVELHTLMGPGVDPHLYKATHGDLDKLNKADLIFYNGLHLEGKMTDLFEKLEKSKNVTAVSKNLDKARLLHPQGFPNTFDPHIWFDVKLWSEAVKEIGNTFMQFDPKNKSYYESNLQNYLSKLDSLDNWIKQEIATIPADRRVLITAHDAFHYFGRAYSIEVKGLQGISTLSDFGLNDISGLVEFIATKKIKAVFIESSVSPKAIEAVIEGCKSKGHDVKLGGTLYSDAMGAEGSAEGTYPGMVKANVITITTALR